MKHDEINIEKDFFNHCLLNKNSKFTWFCDFRQTILYFGLSTRTHIEYRINSSTVSYTLCCFFRLTICVPFFIRKRQLSIKQFWVFSKLVKCTLLITIFGSKSRTQQNSRLFFSSTSLAQFVWTFCAMTFY